jgi:hypothetical protein
MSGSNHEAEEANNPIWVWRADLAMCAAASPSAVIPWLEPRPSYAGVAELFVPCARVRLLGRILQTHDAAGTVTRIRSDLISRARGARLRILARLRGGHSPLDVVMSHDHRADAL